MPVTTQEYPKGRPNFFAYRLTRLMFKAAIANDIGPEACYLITQVAMTEDATRYSKAVRFYNEQLMPVCGFTNVKALDRARKKAVQSGWLIYIPGGKSKAGLYWTVVPEQYLYLSDTPIDDSHSSSELQAAPQDETSLPATGKETGDKREINARETPEKRATIYPIPNSNPNTFSLGENEQVRNPRIPMPESLPNPNAAIYDIETPAGQLTYVAGDERWTQAFVLWWNRFAAKGWVHNWPLNDLDDEMKVDLGRRMLESQWFWKRFEGYLPLHYPDDRKPNLSWFLKRGSLGSVFSGKYVETKEKAKGRNERSNQAGLFGNRESDPTRVRTGSTTDAVAAAFAEAAAKRGE